VRPRGLMQAPHRAGGAPAAPLRMLRLCCPGADLHGSFAEAAAPWEGCCQCNLAHCHAACVIPDRCYDSPLQPARIRPCMCAVLVHGL